MSFALLKLLEHDLRSLSELRDARKNPEVKEAAERALLKLRSVSKALPAEAPAADQAAALAIADEDGGVMLMPVMLALASKSDALPLSALGAVQRMILTTRSRRSAFRRSRRSCRARSCRRRTRAR